MAGLDPKYNQDRIQIFEKEEMFLLNKVISIITAEESRRWVMLEPRSIDSLVPVLWDCKPSQWTKELGHFENSELEVDNKDNIWYTFCKKLRHIKEKS